MYVEPYIGVSKCFMTLLKFSDGNVCQEKYKMDHSPDRNSSEYRSDVRHSYDDLLNVIDRLVNANETLIYEWHQDRANRD